MTLALTASKHVNGNGSEVIPLEKNQVQRRRTIDVHFMVDQQEHQQIRQKMTSAGFSNMGAYLRKQAIDGVVVELDLSEVSEVVRLLRINSNNLNQITKRANETRNIYAADLQDLNERYHALFNKMRDIMTELSRL